MRICIFHGGISILISDQGFRTIPGTIPKPYLFVTFLGVEKTVAHTWVSKNVLPRTKLELPQTPKRNKEKLAVHPQKPTPTLYSDMPTQQSSKTNEVESLFDRILYWKAPATTLERGQKRCVKNTATYTTNTYWFAFFCMFRATRLGMSLRGKMEKLPGIY